MKSNEIKEGGEIKEKEPVIYEVTVRTLKGEWTIELDDEELKDFYDKLQHAKANRNFVRFPNVLINPDHIVHTKSVRKEEK